MNKVKMFYELDQTQYINNYISQEIYFINSCQAQGKDIYMVQSKKFLQIKVFLNS